MQKWTHKVPKSKNRHVYYKLCPLCHLHPGYAAMFTSPVGNQFFLKLNYISTRPPSHLIGAHFTADPLTPIAFLAASALYVL